MEQLLKTKEVAAILRCSDETVLALIRAGRLTAIDVGAGRNKCYRVSQSALAAFQQRASTKPEQTKIARPEPTISRFSEWKKSRRVS